jgi:hypothetical protein
VAHPSWTRYGLGPETWPLRYEVRVTPTFARPVGLPRRAVIRIIPIG